MIFAVAALLALSARDWSFAGLGATEVVLLFCLAVLCVWPGIQWYREGMNWIPLGEGFAAMHLFFYVFPCLSGRTDWMAFPELHRILTLVGVGTFLGAFWIVYRKILLRRRFPLQQAGVMRREVDISIVWTMFAVWVTWNIVVQSGWLPDVGSLLNVLRSFINACGTMAVVYLFYQMGQRRLAGSAPFLAITGLLVALVTSFASGFLNGGAQVIGTTLLAFALGRKRLPAAATFLCIGLLAVLHLGKVEYRKKYWGEAEYYYLARPVGLVEGYTTWLKAAWEGLTSKKEAGEKGRGLVERASLVQVLAKAMEITPVREPFLYGQTYLMLPTLLVPRVFWSDKPRGTLPSETLTIRYGLQTEQGAETTGISFGPVAEAWANFGWLGFIGAGAFFAMFFGLPARTSLALTPRQVGWLLASIFLIYSFDLEHAIAEVCSPLLQALLMGIALVFMTSHKSLFRHHSRKRLAFAVTTSQRAGTIGNGLSGGGNIQSPNPS